MSGYVRPKYHTLNMLKRMAVVTPKVVIGNPILNAIEIVRIVKELNYSVDSDGVPHGGVQAVVFPELCMVGHSIGHLHFHERTHGGVVDGLRFILRETATINMLVVVGAPWQAWGRNFNVQIVIHKGRVLAIIPKQDLTSTAEYQEHKFFVSGDDAVDDFVNFDGEKIPFNMHVLVEFPDEGNLVFGFTNCEDDWGADGKGQLALLHGATVIMHSNASSEFVGKANFRRDAFNVMAALGFGAWLYAASGPWESGRDFILSTVDIVSFLIEVQSSQRLLDFRLKHSMRFLMLTLMRAFKTKCVQIHFQTVHGVVRQSLNVLSLPVILGRQTIQNRTYMMKCIAAFLKSRLFQLILQT